MRRLIVSTGVALLLTAAPAFAQETPTQREPLPPEPAIAGVVQVTEVILSVDGRRVDAAPTGVAVVATLVLQNGGAERINNVRVTVAQAAEDEATLTRSEDTVGDVEPGATGRAEISFTIHPQRCNEFIGLTGEAIFDGGSSPIKIGIPVACPGPRLWLENVEFEGGDGDGVPEPGETLRMFVTLRNEGRDPARGARARVSVRGEGISAGGTDLEWRDIAAGGSGRSVTAIVVEVARDAPAQQQCDDLPRGEPVPDSSGDGSVPPDSTVSSDGATSLPSSGTGYGSAAGSTGAGAPGSAGSDLPATTEPNLIADPAPGKTEPIEPLPAPAPNETPSDGREPAPHPGEPNPEPTRDVPVRLDAKLAISAAEHTTELEYSTAIFCTMREGDAVALGRPALAPRASAAEDASGGDGTIFPVAMALLVSAAALGTRAALIR